MPNHSNLRFDESLRYPQSPQIIVDRDIAKFFSGAQSHCYPGGLLQVDGSLERLAKESELLRQAYGHFFDLTVVNNDIEDTIHTLEATLDTLDASPQWLPVAWVY